MSLHSSCLTPIVCAATGTVNSAGSCTWGHIGIRHRCFKVHVGPNRICVLLFFFKLANSMQLEICNTKFSILSLWQRLECIWETVSATKVRWIIYCIIRYVKMWTYAAVPWYSTPLPLSLSLFRWVTDESINVRVCYLSSRMFVGPRQPQWPRARLCEGPLRPSWTQGPLLTGYTFWIVKQPPWLSPP